MDWATINSYKQVLMVGATSGGKSTLLNRMASLNADGKNNNPNDNSGGKFTLATAPTRGFDRQVVSLRKKNILCVEIGGSMKTTWHAYLGKCDLVLYVVDISDRLGLAQAVFDMLQLMSDKRVADVPFILLLHKTDSDASLKVSQTELNALVRLDDIKTACTQPFEVMEASGVTGAGVPELIERLFAILKPE